MEQTGIKLNKKGVERVQQEKKNKKSMVSKVMFVSVFTNIFLAILKIITGIIFTSVALVADGIHSFSDLITDFFAIIGSYFAQKPADLEHPFGHGNLEYLTSLGIGLMVLVVGIGVIYNSITGSLQVPNTIVIVVSIFTIITKMLLSTYILNKGKKYHNSILISSGKESRSDVISSIVVLISSILIQFKDEVPIFLYAEKVAAVIVGLFIFSVGFSIMRDNVSILLGRQEENEDYMNRLKKLVAKEEGIIDVKNIVLLRYGPVSTLNLIVTMDGDISLKEAHEKADILEEKIKKFSHYIQYIHIHIEPSLKVD